MSNQANQQTKQVVKPQIAVSKNQKTVFEVLDGLSAIRKYSKVKLTGVDFSRKSATQASVIVTHNVNVDVFKVIAHDILNGTFTEYAEYKGFPANRPDGSPEAHTLKINYQPKRPDGQVSNYPYTISMSSGKGATIGQGAVKMVQVEKSVTINLSVMDMRRMVISTVDYIHAWEVHNFKAIVAEASKPYDGESEEETA